MRFSFVYPNPSSIYLFQVSEQKNDFEIDTILEIRRNCNKYHSNILTIYSLICIFNYTQFEFYDFSNILEIIRQKSQNPRRHKRKEKVKGKLEQKTERGHSIKKGYIKGFNLQRIYHIEYRTQCNTKVLLHLFALISSLTHLTSSPKSQWIKVFMKQWCN